jgi:hypothetical protein
MAYADARTQVNWIVHTSLFWTNVTGVKAEWKFQRRPRRTDSSGWAPRAPMAPPTTGNDEYTATSSGFNVSLRDTDGARLRLWSVCILAPQSLW